VSCKASAHGALHTPVRCDNDQPNLAPDFRDKVPHPTTHAADRPLRDPSGPHPPPAPAQSRYDAGVEDLIILPLAALAVAARRLGRAALSALIHILDWAFPILLQVARFPLFTVRMIGDGVTAVLKGIVRFLPVSGTARDAWRQRVSEYWAWLRQKFSYRAFEEAVHHVFEHGMAWTFKTCRTLTPTGALLVIAGAVLWLPVSFGIATALHGVLIAKATVWPAWMQLLHPFATIIAKSKLLVLPAYPAAWPQAKQHSLVQAAYRLYQWLAAHYLAQKTGYRYRQTERAATDGALALRRSADDIGLRQLSGRLLDGLNDLAARTAKGARIAVRRTLRGLSALPLIGAIIRRYETQYDEAADQQDPARLSERVRGFFERWSIKFSAEHYETKDVEVKSAEAKADRGAAPGAAPPPPTHRTPIRP
jgi:hypothetical protein